MTHPESFRSVENIVRLPSARRIVPVASTTVARAPVASAVLFAGWVATRDRAAAALLSGAQCVMLTGPAGTGKTVLIEHVARVLRAAGRTVVIQLADADPAPPGPGVTLFVDEADRLSAPKLRQLLDGSAGAVVLVGLASLARRVAAGPLHLTLDPLGPVEAQDYIARWLAATGRTPADLDSKAVRVLVEVSGGVPRLLSILLAGAAWLATTGGASVIEAVHIEEAAELRSVLAPPVEPEIGIVERRPMRSRRVWSVLLAGLVLTVTAAAIGARLFPAGTARLEALATPFVRHAERWLHIEPDAPRPRPTLIAPQATTPVVMPAPASPPAQASVPERVEAPVETALPEAPVAPAPPEPAVAQPAPTTPPEASVPVPAKTSAAVLPVETIEFLLRRGREMLALGDLSATRLLFARAAEGGSAEAMLELGQTYDPAFLPGLTGNRQSDPAEAMRWYRQAAANGNAAAERRLSTR